MEIDHYGFELATLIVGLLVGAELQEAVFAETGLHCVAV